MIEENISFTDNNVWRTELNLKLIGINLELIVNAKLLNEVLIYIIELSNIIL